MTPALLQVRNRRRVGASGRSRPMLARRPAWAAVVGLLGLAAALTAAGCGGSGSSIEDFRASHTECNPNFFRTPCQIGPDGKLYKYEQGERD